MTVYPDLLNRVSETPRVRDWTLREELGTLSQWDNEYSYNLRDGKCGFNHKLVNCDCCVTTAMLTSDRPCW